MLIKYFVITLINVSWRRPSQPPRELLCKCQGRWWSTWHFDAVPAVAGEAPAGLSVCPGTAGWAGREEMNEPLEPCLSKHGAIEALSIFPCLLIDMSAEPR